MMNPILPAIFLSLFALPVAAQAPADLVTGGMRAGWRTGAGTHMGALQLDLAEGWKTYWRAPGDAGIPPQFDWSGSENLASVAFHWPRPEVFVQNGMRSIGYHDQLVLPMEFTPIDPSRPIMLTGAVSLGICDDICRPVALSVQAELPPDGRISDPAILQALDQRPDNADPALRSSLRCEVEPIRDGLRLTARMEVPPMAADEIAVIELADRTVWVSETATYRDGRKLAATADLVPATGAPFALDRSGIRITLLGDNRAVDLVGCPAG